MFSEPSKMEPRAGGWFAKPRSGRWSLRALPGFFFLFVAYQIANLVSMHETAISLFVSDLFALVCVAYVALWALRSGLDFAARRRNGDDDRFSDRPPGLEEFAVEAVVVMDGRTLGIDRGVVWFADHLLHFHGGATSFVLAAEDVYTRAKNIHYRDLPDDAVRLAVPGGVAYVRLRPLIGRGFRTFPESLRIFMNVRGIAPPGAERQWPPLEPYEALEPTRAALS